MNMKLDEIDDIINKINNEIYSITEDTLLILSLHSDSYSYLVKFCGIPVWCSDEDERGYIDEENDVREDLHYYLINQIKKIVDSLNKMPFKEIVC